MDRFNWRHLVIISDQQTTVSYCSYGAMAIYNWMSANINYTVYQIPMTDLPTDDDLDFYLDSIQSRTRGQLV